MKITVMGVYPVEEAQQPCHVIELEIVGDGTLDIGAIRQPNLTLPPLSWQVPYDEYRLTATGDSGELLDLTKPVEIGGRTRIAFFFHHLIINESLDTPAGAVRLPAVTPLPARLRFMRYDPPC